MPVYVLREGSSNVFEIGITEADDVDRRRRQLNSGSSVGLRTFDVINLEPALEAEMFLHKLLAHRKVSGFGGTEFFEMMSENHMRAFLEYAVPLFSRFQATHNNLSSLEQVPSSTRLRFPDQADYATLSELKQVRSRLRELDDEAALLRAEAELLEATLKAKIGSDLGIAGVATWESSRSTPRFCKTEFINREPEIYKDVLHRFPKLDCNAWMHQEPSLYREVTGRFPQLDATTWSRRDEKLYQQMRSVYFTATVSRKFLLTESELRIDS